MSTTTYNKDALVTIPEGYDIVKAIHGEETAKEWKLNYDFNRSKIEIYQLINHAFGWSHSRQGHDYWSKINDKHKRLLVSQPTEPTSTTPSTPTIPPGYLEEIAKKKEEDAKLRAEYKQKQEEALEMAAAAKKKLAKKLSELVVELEEELDF